MTTLIDCVLGDERVGRALPPRRMRGARRLRGRAVHPHPARAPSCTSGAKAGAFVEIKNSEIGAGREGAPPLLHRRRRRRRGLEHRRRHDHRQLRRPPQAPDRDRQERAHGRPHLARRAGDRRRRRLHWCRLGGDRRRARGRARRSPARARPTSRATPSGRPPPRKKGSDECRKEDGCERRGADGAARSGADAVDRRGADAHERSDALRQAPDGVRRARQPGARRQDRGQARDPARPGRAEDVLQRRGLLPLPGVDPRRGRVHRAVDARAGEPQPDGAAADDRRGEGRLRAPHHRRACPGTATRARTRSPRRASRSRPGSWRACSRPRAPTACSRCTCTPARCRASSRSRSTT